MESVEVRYGRGDKRRTLGWLVVGPDGFLRYVPNGGFFLRWQEYVWP